MRTKTRKTTPRIKNTLGLEGKIYNKDGIEIGEYKYSLYHNTYTFVIMDGTPHHFWKPEELQNYIAQNNWSTK